MPPLAAPWRDTLALEFTKPYFRTLSKAVETAYANEIVYPKPEDLFRAFSLCPPTDVNVVILGQDPYHREGQAHGLAFSVPEGVRRPPSLRNIYKELAGDLGNPLRTTGDLTDWATQGVLLLNTTLTVLPGKPGSHHGLGWETFTDMVITTIANERSHVVFLLWGKYAEAKRHLIDETEHCVLTAPHPSPLSAYTGFFGCQHFSTTNEYLRAHGKEVIRW